MIFSLRYQKLFIFFLIIAFLFLAIKLDLFSSLGRFLIGLDFRSGLKQRNAQLVFENENLRATLNELAEIKEENEFLRNFCGLEHPPEFQYVLANVSGRWPFNLSSVFVIDKGKDSGLKIGRAVLWGRKILVGKIKEVEKRRAIVQTLFASDTKMTVFVGEKRVPGVLRGLESKIIVEFLPKDEELIVGEKIVTSGLDDELPKGLTIGRVKKIIDGAEGIFKQVEVELPYQWTDLERVMIIKNQK